MPAFAKPVWIEQGPGPLALPTATYNIAAGAIQALVVDPTSSDRVFVASVGGGIWMSSNAVSAADPTWLPQSDYAPSLTMSAIAMSPLDSANNTLYAGSGRTTHGAPQVGPNGGPLFGLLKTVNGGASWKEIGRADFQGKFVSRILPTAVESKTGDRVLVGTLEGGFHVSIDSGATWAISAAVSPPVTDLAAESRFGSRIYVAAAGRIYRSDDAGAMDWHDVTPSVWSTLPAWSTIRFAISPGTDFAGNHWVYASATSSGTSPPVVFSSDLGNSWNSIGMPADGSIPGSPMAVSPLRPDALFCVSNAGSPNHYMAIVAVGVATQWTSIEASGANGTGPHTDARDCAFATDGNVLFEVNDGGISRLANPHGFSNGTPRKWTQAVGNIRVAEFYSIAYDSRHHILFGAAQDNAIPQQTAPGDANWTINEDAWGDGMQVGVDNTSTPGASMHYSSQQNLFHFLRRTYTSATQVSSSIGLDPMIDGTGGLFYNQVEGAIRDDGTFGTVRWNQTWVLNSADPTRLLLGTDYLYESFNRGTNFTSLGGIAQNAKGEPVPANPVGTVSAYAYGHIYNHDVIYLGAGGQLLVRVGASGLPQAVGTYPGGMPVGIALDSTDWKRAYVLDGNARLFRTNDAGATAKGWVELTGNLAQFTGDLRSILVLPFPTNGGYQTVLVAGYGGVYVLEDALDARFPMWRKHGANFPNAIVSKITYSSVDDVLVAGTYGRAAWLLPHAIWTLIDEPILRIVSSQATSCVMGWVEGSSVTFTASITSSTPLTSPLTYEWTVLGGVAPAGMSTPKLMVTMPPAGTEVVILVTVTDGSGYQMVAHEVGMSITAQVARLRLRFCELIAKIREEMIWRPYVNPFGPDGGPEGWLIGRVGRGDGLTLGADQIAGLPPYAAYHALVNELAARLAELARVDQLKKTQPALHETFRSAASRWRLLEAATGRITAILGPSDGAKVRTG